MERALLDHVVSRMTADVDFLVSQQLLASSDGELIKQKLRAAPSAHALSGQMSALNVTSRSPEPYSATLTPTPTPPPAATLAPPTTSANLPPRQLQTCRALWDYPQAQVSGNHTYMYSRPVHHSLSLAARNLRTGIVAKYCTAPSRSPTILVSSKETL